MKQCLCLLQISSSEDTEDVLLQHALALSEADK